MRTGFCRYRLLTPERRRTEHFDDARIADRHVEAAPRRVEEDDVRNAGDGFARHDLATVRVNLEQDAPVARTEQPSAGDVEVKPL